MLRRTRLRADRAPDTAPRFAIRPFALTLHLAVAGLTGGAAAWAPTALAQANDARDYAIPAGPLTAALNQLAADAGVFLTAPGTLTQGKATAGLQGRYTVQAAFQALLIGSGLRAVRQSDNAYTLRAESADANAAAVLEPVAVFGSFDAPVSEGTGSYTVPVSNTATKMNLSIRETPQSISVITRQQIEDQQLNSMTDVLHQTPGITMSQDGGERFNIYSRGSAMDTYQLDGVTTTQVNQSRTMPSTLLDMALYDRVEVVRGATGLMTGAGSPSGTVNLIRKRPTHEFQAYAQVGAGSWDLYRAEADISGPLSSNGTLRGRMVVAKQDNHTFMDAYTQDKDVLYGVVEADLTDTTLLRFGIDHQRYKATGAPGVPLLYTNGQRTDFTRSTSSGARWMYDEFKTTNYTLNFEQALAHDWQFKVAANHMDVERSNLNGSYRVGSGRSFLDQATGRAGMLAYRAGATQTQTGVDVTIQGPFDLGGRTHDFIAGFNFQHYENKHKGWDVGVSTVDFSTWGNNMARPGNTGTVGEIFNVKSRQNGSYAALRLNPVNDVHLILGARRSDYNYDYYYESPADSFLQTYTMRARGEITPYAGIVYDLTPEQSVYASYTDIFQPQSSQDRNGNVLDPIVGKNYEMGWKGEFLNRRLNTSVAIYRSQKDNVAELDAGYTVPGTDNAAYRAAKGARTTGIDLEVAGEILPGWNMHAGFSHAKTEDAQGAQLLTQQPVDTLRLWTTYRLGGAWNRLTVGGGVDWTSKTSLYFSRYDSTVKQDAYTVVNLMARYQFNKKLAATLNINNLFDKAYYQGIGGSYGHYGSPRFAGVTLRYDF
ncbi:TonB-dependent siderophore receptor [Achromobacter xylosoxidans]|uniref:TonB-dependent siderophore receptor n=1 Tax=Alcaligenes xylosoxydans xylosoxydans TaxID=85698 RepID=UPI0012A841EF|nr:TonB-dependent receptor [Achromobacter xylosoxidans]CUR79555.1 Ferric-pseudobactin 358 receptor precursor [Achromobacter xylosoxidans]